MQDARKINYYEISVTRNQDCRECIESAIRMCLDYNEAKSRYRQKPVSSGGVMQIVEIRRTGNYYECLAKAIRGEFPEVMDIQEDTVETMEAEEDPNKGIPEETHFVISVEPYLRHPIVAVESTMRGPKQADIQKFLEAMLIHSGVEAEFQMDPVFGFSYEEFLSRIDDVSQIRMMFHREDLKAYSQYDPSTAEYIRQSMEYSGAEYVTIEFWVDFRKKKNRYPTDGLMDKVRHFINVLLRFPDAKNHIKHLDVKAEDRNFNNRLRLFDLIEAKVASEVSAERKRPRSQYYNSHSLYEEIRAQIEKDFKPRSEVVSPAD